MNYELNKDYIGIIYKINNTEVNFTTTVCFNEFYQAIVTILDITPEFSELFDYKCFSGNIILGNAEVLTFFEAYFQKSTYSLNDKENSKITLQIIVPKIIIGRNEVSSKTTFSEISFEISDGHELIGLCPYDFNKNGGDILIRNNIEIPAGIKSIEAETKIGKFGFASYPRYTFSKNAFSLEFGHNIYYCPNNRFTIAEYEGILHKTSDLLTLLCGEIISINKINLIVYQEDEKPDSYEFIGFCNFLKNQINRLDYKGFDTTSYKRLYIFKISDFLNLKSALVYWFDNYDKLYNAHQAYGRILLDEEMKLVTVNKFLASMQLVEGYAQAFDDEKDDMKRFNEDKNRVIFQLHNEDDKKFVEKYLRYSGTTFRKVLINFLFEAIIIFEKMSKNSFKSKYDNLFTNIVNDRNYYTHSSNRSVSKLSISELMEISEIIKDLYRVNILLKMGVEEAVISCRCSNNREFPAYLKNIFDIELEDNDHIPDFDKAMWEYSN